MFLAGNRIPESGPSSQRRRRVRGTGQLNDPQRSVRPEVLELFQEVFSGTHAFVVKIAADMGGVKALVLHIDHPVLHDDGNSRFLRFPQHAVPAVLDNRAERNHVHLIGDKGPERFDLFLLGLVRVVHHQMDTGFFRRGGD